MSISEVVDEVIQNCPIDVRRPLYKVNYASCTTCFNCYHIHGYFYGFTDEGNPGFCVLQFLNYFYASRAPYSKKHWQIGTQNMFGRDNIGNFLVFLPRKSR